MMVLTEGRRGRLLRGQRHEADQFRDGLLTDSLSAPRWAPDGGRHLGLADLGAPWRWADNPGPLGPQNAQIPPEHPHTQQDPSRPLSPRVRPPWRWGGPTVGSGPPSKTSEVFSTQHTALRAALEGRDHVVSCSGTAPVNLTAASAVWFPSGLGLRDMITG